MHNVEERSLSTVTVYTRSSHTSDTPTVTGGTLRVVSMRTAARTVVFHTTCMPVSSTETMSLDDSDSLVPPSISRATDAIKLMAYHTDDISERQRSDLYEACLLFLLCLQADQEKVLNSR